MERSAFLSSLPFLHFVARESTVDVWKAHRDQIVEFLTSQPTDKSSILSTHDVAERRCTDNGTDKVSCLFSYKTHAVSIEPNIYHSGESGIPAFFLTGDDDEDPALTGFAVFLMPTCLSKSSSITFNGNSNISKSFNIHDSHKKRKYEQTSPAASSASTSMSTPLGASIGGGKFHNNIDCDHEIGFKSHLLYFVFTRHFKQNSGNNDEERQDTKEDIEVFFVDHQSIKSLEIAPSSDVTKKDKDIITQSHLKETKNSSKQFHKPMSLLIKFDNCNFRIFGKDFLVTSKEKEEKIASGTIDNDISLYEDQIRVNFEIIRDFIGSYEEKIVHLGCNPFPSADIRSSSIYSYLSCMMSPFSHENHYQESHSTHEYGQIEKAPTTDEDTTCKSNISGDQEAQTNTNETIETTNSADKKDQKSRNNKLCNNYVSKERKRKLHSYHTSWDHLEQALGMIDSSEKRSISRKLFPSLIQRSAHELGKSYVIDDYVGLLNTDKSVFTSRGILQNDVATKVADLQDSIDQKLHTIFATSGVSGRSFPLKTPLESNYENASIENIHCDLNTYRQAISAQHKLMFMPSR